MGSLNSPGLIGNVQRENESGQRSMGNAVCESKELRDGALWWQFADAVGVTV